MRNHTKPARSKGYATEERQVFTLKRKHMAIILFGVFVAFSLGYVLGIKGRSGTFSVLGAQGAGTSRTQGENTPATRHDAASEQREDPSPTMPTPTSDAPVIPPVKGDVRIPINTATAGELTDLPGIGPVLAKRIVDYRNQNGPFSDGEALMKVKGIGFALLGDIEEFITFD